MYNDLVDEKFEISKRLYNTLNDLNLWDLRIYSDGYNIVVDGHREKLMWLLKDIFDWDRDVDYITHTINYFTIEIKLNNNILNFKFN